MATEKEGKGLEREDNRGEKWRGRKREREERESPPPNQTSMA